jgi:hypothetical protein
MLSKCANPACSEKFLRLHQGKLFTLSPTPEVEASARGFVRLLYERFWLCDRCSKVLTLMWAGTEVKLVPLPEKRAANPAVEKQNQEGPQNTLRRRRRAAASSD